MFRVLGLVHHRNGVILKRNMTLALFIIQNVVLAQTEPVRPLARNDHHRGRQKDPVKTRLLLQQIVELARAANAGPEGFEGGREFRRVQEFDPGRRFQAGRSAYGEETLHAGFLHSRNDRAMPADVPVEDLRAGNPARGIVGADHHIVASQDPRELIPAQHIPLDDGKIWMWRDALRPGACAVVQTITIADERFDRYRQSADFIQQYIFPGGMLASPSRFAAEARAAGLEIVNVRRFGHDYAETLKRWLAAFDAQVDAVSALGFDQRFIRCWRFYLAYCTAGFTSETTDVAQYTLSAR